MGLAELLSTLVSAAGFDPNNHPSNIERNKAIAGTLFGYGASLLKACGVSLDQALAVLHEKWAGMQGGNN